MYFRLQVGAVNCLLKRGNERSMRHRLGCARSECAPATPHEVEKFRVDAGKNAQCVAYDAAKRMIVVTMGEHFKDQRFAIQAEEKGGPIAWTCRTIDLDPKYLPAACR